MLPKKLHLRAPRIFSRKEIVHIFKCNEMNCSGSSIFLSTAARAVEARIPMTRPPLIFFISKKIITSRPKRPIRTVGVKGPAFTSVCSSLTTIPSLVKPMNVINRPMPTAMAEIRDAGIASTILLLSPNRVSIRNNHPERNTTPNAVCQSIFPEVTR
ncbi:hypothetical protein ES703_122613 [subsurface metagenome]